jgi:hypothetical protein
MKLLLLQRPCIDVSRPRGTRQGGVLRRIRRCAGNRSVRLRRGRGCPSTADSRVGGIATARRRSGAVFPPRGRPARVNGRAAASMTPAPGDRAPEPQGPAAGLQQRGSAERVMVRVRDVVRTTAAAGPELRLRQALDGTPCTMKRNGRYAIALPTASATTGQMRKRRGAL